jgi:hypothetical protein
MELPTTSSTFAVEVFSPYSSTKKQGDSYSLQTYLPKQVNNNKRYIEYAFSIENLL